MPSTPATSASASAIPATRTILPFVPKVSMANALAAWGAASMKNPPTATSGDAAGGGQRGHEVPDAQREGGGEDAREGGRGEGGGDGARVGLHGRSCAAPHRLDHSGTEEPSRGGVELLGVVFLFAGFLVSIEVFREIRIPFTHRVLHVRHAGA